MAFLRAGGLPATGGLTCPRGDGPGRIGWGVLGTDLVQQCISAARTAVILTTEPVFAALFGYWLSGDRLVALQVFGAALILSALVVGEVAPGIMSPRKQTYEKGDVL